MKTIKIGDPQPLHCPNCVLMHGYQVSENIKTQYHTQYLADGDFGSGFYGDTMKTISISKDVYCCNCNTKLPFKVKSN